MNPKIEKVARDIREMKVQGAIGIALAAARAMESLIRESKARTRQDFLKELEQAGNTLIKARPTAVALPNAVKSFIKKVKAVDKDLPQLKRQALIIGNNLIKEVVREVEIIGKMGAEVVENNSTILIHCHSSTIMSVLKEAWKKGKKFEVICTETRPKQQGFISARELSDFGIPVTLVVDSAVMSYMPKINIVLVGADTITKDGKLINKIGTSQIALIAKQFNKPLYVATERLKFDKTRTAEQVKIEERPSKELIDQTKLPRVKIENPAFDITEPEYIKGIITERGILSEW